MLTHNGTKYNRIKIQKLVYINDLLMKSCRVWCPHDAHHICGVDTPWFKQSVIGLYCTSSGSLSTQYLRWAANTNSKQKTLKSSELFNSTKHERDHAYYPYKSHFVLHHRKEQLCLLTPPQPYFSCTSMSCCCCTRLSPGDSHCSHLS